MARTVKAKWGIGSDKPEDLPDFLSNDEIAEKMAGHPKGRFRLKIKGVPTIVANKNGDDMIKFMAEVNDPDKDKRGFNGYALWENQNITDQGKPFLLKWLKALGVTWEDFLNNSKVIEATSLDPSQLAAIGKVNFGAKNSKIYVEAVLGKDNRPDYDNSRVVRWVPKDEATSSDEDVDEDDDTGEDEGDETGVDEDELTEELDALSDVKLKARAKANGAKLADYKGKDHDELVEFVLLQELEETEEEAEAEEDDEAEAELREELEALGIVALRKRAKANDSSFSTTGMKAPALVDAIVEQELAEEDGEEDSEDAEAELREELAELTLGDLKKRCKENGRKLVDYRKVTDPDKLIEMIVEDELESDDNEPPF